MSALKTRKFVVLGLTSLLGVVACSGPKIGPLADKYEREDDEAVYEEVLGDFAKAYEGASKIKDDNLRFVTYAKAEAELLNSGVFVPTTTQGGAYTITRVAPRTIPYVFFGNDSDKVKTMVMVKGDGKFITKEDRNALLDEWKKAAAGEGTYDPEASLKAKGYEIGTEYATTTSAAPATLDMLSTSKQADTEQMVNCVEGLIQYDNFGTIYGASASAWENENNQKYTFTIRDGAAWYTSDKQKYADVTADDFVAGFQHMLDADGGLDYLVDGIVKGVSEYLAGEKGFDEVGVKAEGNKVVFELVEPESYFITRLTYSVFAPINRAFFLAHGGAFGIEEFAQASASPNYSYGKAGDITSQLYNSAFIPTTWDLSDSGGSIVLEKNANYWDAANVKVTKASWQYDDGSQPLAIYNATVKGDYPGIGLGEASGLLAQAKKDGNFDKFAYVSDTNATTFFGGMNLNRGAFDYEGAVKSTQSEKEKVLTHAAFKNAHFRKAVLYGWDRATWNAVTRGEDLKATNLRNMYTQPEFVSINADVKFNGKTYKQGSSYGELVQSFCNDLGLKVNVKDGVDGWFNADEAVKEIKAFEKDFGNNWPKDDSGNKMKIVIDNVYLSTSASVTAQAKSFEELIENVLGQWVDVRLVEAKTTAEYYYSGYYAETGADLNQDIFYGSGWGPDYGDPSTYLDTFAAGGYMTKVVGLF
jgi:peptide/nickel transport system substrate-binding protein/oligopeptide transport system substrate-binding protein